MSLEAKTPLLATSRSISPEQVLSQKISHSPDIVSPSKTEPKNIKVPFEIKQTTTELDSKPLDEIVETLKEDD